MKIERRRIEGFPGYRIGNDGFLQSERGRQGQLTGQWNTLSGTTDQDGYFVVTLYKDTKKTNKKVHRLVLEAFVGPCPKNMECCHMDNNRKNNRLDNLKWGTSKENANHRRIAGTIVRGTMQSQAKIKESDVPLIREKYSLGCPQYKIAEEFNVSKATIQRITSGKLWRHA